MRPINAHQIDMSQPFRKELVIASIVAAALMFIGLVALGIPGAIFWKYRRGWV